MYMICTPCKLVLNSLKGLPQDTAASKFPLMTQTGKTCKYLLCYFLFSAFMCSVPISGYIHLHPITTTVV